MREITVYGVPNDPETMQVLSLIPDLMSDDDGMTYRLLHNPLPTAVPVIAIHQSVPKRSFVISGFNPDQIRRAMR